MNKKNESKAEIKKGVLTIQHANANKAGDVALRIYSNSGAQLHYASTRSNTMAADSKGFNTPCPAEFDGLKFELKLVGDKKEVLATGVITLVEEPVAEEKPVLTETASADNKTDKAKESK